MYKNILVFSLIRTKRSVMCIQNDKYCAYNAEILFDVKLEITQGFKKELQFIFRGYGTLYLTHILLTFKPIISQ